MYGAEAWGPYLPDVATSQCPVRSLQQGALALLGGCRGNANLNKLCFLFDQVHWIHHIHRKAIRFLHKTLSSDSCHLFHLCLQHLDGCRGTGSWLDRTLGLLHDEGMVASFDSRSLSMNGVPRDWHVLWEQKAMMRVRTGIRNGWSATEPSAQGWVLAHCRDSNFHVQSLLAAVPNFSYRQLVARFLSGMFGVARVHGHYRRSNVAREDRRLCHLCLRKGRRAYDDEVHVLVDCPELLPMRLGMLMELREHLGTQRTDRVLREGPSVSLQLDDGPDRILKVLRAVLYAAPGRVDVFNAYNIGKFLEKAWRVRARV